MSFRFHFVLLFCATFLFHASCSSARRSELGQHSPITSISSHDASVTAAPTPYPTKPLVIIDAGHGGTDEGARVHSFMEKRITLTTAILTKKLLEERGYKVIMTRSRDTYISLPRRVSIANKTKAALFVSIHFNASRYQNAKGMEIYFCDTSEKWRASASRRLANCILYQLVDQTAATSRGIKGGNFHVIRETEMPAVLVEGGFVTNIEERSLLSDKEYLRKIAHGIALGVDKYFKS
ncbi:MAG: N-acetylmuramoyl-L-alanine amidase [Chlamydiales bacterium]